jgi:8-oxo-dGTP pyrophosphatase MutT (NUDIX family)
MLPVDAVAGESALATERMSAAWLRQRFAQQPDWHPEHIDSQTLQRMTQLQGKPVTPASVLIPIVMHEQQPTLLFTQRAAHLTDHAGQVSFPGGRMEESDASPVETALREAEEEIGLARSQVEVIGSLPKFLKSRWRS